MEKTKGQGKEINFEKSNKSKAVTESQVSSDKELEKNICSNFENLRKNIKYDTKKKIYNTVS